MSWHKFVWELSRTAENVKGKTRRIFRILEKYSHKEILELI
jgi:hypothetical protein